MSAFKKLRSQDVFITEHLARKSWNVTGSEFSGYGIEEYTGISGSSQYYVTPDDLVNGRHTPLVYRSIKHLYYSNFKHGENTYSGSFDNYLASSFVQRSSILEGLNEITVLSIPRDIVGENIHPGTLEIDFEVSGSTYDKILDDGEGRLFYSGSAGHPQTGVTTAYFNDGELCGDIIYEHGIIVLTDPGLQHSSSLYHNLQWRSSLTVYTLNVNSHVRDFEFNFTQNPSALTGSDATVTDNLTGSQFSPYMTTLGFYNDENELIMVSKPGQPIPISRDTDMTFITKIDI